MTNELARTIDTAWEIRDTLGLSTKGEVREAVDAALDGLDCGRWRVAERRDGEWRVNQWLKKAVLLSFRLTDMKRIDGAPGGASWWDKVDSKFAGWDDAKFRVAGFRAVPGAVVRRTAFIAKGVVLMPCFVNLGAYVDEGTMVDTWATVGSCAQIGARAEVAEGVIVGEGSVLSMGVYLGQSTKIVDRASGEVLYGRVPPYSVVVSGTMPAGEGKPSLYCAVIVKHVDEKTRAKTSINELLRD